MKRTLKRGAILLFILGNLYGILCGGLYFFQESMLFHPEQLPKDYVFEFDVPFEEIYQEGEGGVQLHGLHFPVANAKGVIVYYHGNAGSVRRWGEITQFFTQKGYAVIVMDYRGYGKSETSSGKSTKPEQALYDDSEVWYAFAKANYEESQIHVYGRSLGTTFATYVASKNNPKNLTLETPFYSIEDEAVSRFKWLPVKRLLKYRMPTYTFIGNVSCPITVFHGTEDAVVAYEHGQKLFNTITTASKEFITIPDGGHNNLITFPTYTNAIDRVLEKGR
ncbi:alpha/beta hydrolase [uncultured Dokdonia sp.]|uniref:alpha/beta hydrolase n=1 Tax=uncultured Dokdonia sp. TaxID=575653 RepID=UPI0026184531|nr:alpha/beta hydrolase [uncultured Dokdonia sp.]